MFDLRYHVTSLAAVFIALLIGILVGVALASHGLGNSERKSLEDGIRRAQNRVDALQNGAIDWASVDTLVEFYLQCGVQGLTNHCAPPYRSCSTGPRTLLLN